MTWESIITRWTARIDQAETLLACEDWEGLASLSWDTPSTVISAQPTSEQVQQLRSLRVRSDGLQKQIQAELREIGETLGADSTLRTAARAYSAGDTLSR